MRRAILTLTVVALVVIAGCAGGADDGGMGAAGGGDGGVGGDGGAGGVGDGSGAAEGDSNIGVAVGGAQDANGFRTNVEEGYVPQPTDMTYEGLFHDYYFDTAQDQPCEARFCPSYSPAVTQDPLSNETERFVTVGLNSGITQESFERQPLNLVVVVDTSGSMDSKFDEYHYDGDDGETVENQRKMDAASEAVVSMLGHLDGEDRVSVVGYDNQATVVQDLRRVDETDMGELRSNVRGLRAEGGTNLDAGMQTAHDVVADHADESERETRVIYVTDAMPNLQETSGDTLEERLTGYANEGIHSTFVGVGVDFNSRLTEQISTVRGANYYTVNSPTEFHERMDEGFEYMVTPLVHNLSLTVETEGYEVEAVYGSPQADRASEKLMEVNTLFPSRREGNRTEGGVVLLEVEKQTDDATLQLAARYENPDGTEREVTRTVGFDDYEAPYYGSTGVRKAVTLSEYATLMRNWAVHERRGGEEPVASSASEGIEYRSYDDQWEQTSVDLQVSEPYDERIRAFVPYYERQMEALGADRMHQDLAVLQTLVDQAGTATPTATSETTERSDESAAQPPGSATATESPVDTDDRSAAALAGPFGNVGPLVGLVNLAATVLIAAYGIGQKRRSRDRTPEVDP